MEMLTVQDVVALRGCSQPAVQRQISSGKIKTQLVTESGIRKHLIPLTELEPTLQRKWLAGKGQLPEKESSPKVMKRLDDFTADERQAISRWMDILTRWVQFRAAYGGSKADADNAFLLLIQREQPDLSISIDILRRKNKALQAKDYAGLIDNRGKWAKGITKMPQEIWAVFLNYYLSDHRPSVQECINATRDVLELTAPELIDQMPGYYTFYRRLQTVREDLIVRGREGEKAYNDKCAPHIRRDYTKLQSNDCWIADNHTFDFFSEAPDGGRHRLHLTCFIDARSGMPVGWNITDNPCSESTIIALRHGILRGGIPKTAYMDNGSEFLTHDIAGRGHRTRKSQEGKFIPPPIFARLGIEMKNALVRNAKAKPIERSFLDFKGMISKHFSTYCGGNVLERPESLKKVLKSGNIPTDAEVRDMVNDLMEGYVSHLPYGGTVVKDRGLTKAEVFKKYLPNPVRYATEDELDLMLQRSTRPQKIGRNGVYIKTYGVRLEYGMEELAPRFGQSVYLRYDPSDLGTVRVYAAPEDTYITTVSMNRETRLLFLDSEENIKIAQQKIRGITKKNKKAFDNVREMVPPERRIDILDLKLRKAQQNITDGNMALDNAMAVEFQMSQEVRGTPQDYSNIKSVMIDVERMNANAARRRR